MTDAVPRHQASLFDSARGRWRPTGLSGAVQRTRLCLYPRLALHYLLSAVCEVDEGASWRRGHGEEFVPLSKWLDDASVV